MKKFLTVLLLFMVSTIAMMGQSGEFYNIKENYNFLVAEQSVGYRSDNGRMVKFEMQYPDTVIVAEKSKNDPIEGVYYTLFKFTPEILGAVTFTATEKDIDGEYPSTPTASFTTYITSSSCTFAQIPKILVNTNHERVYNIKANFDLDEVYGLSGRLMWSYDGGSTWANYSPIIPFATLHNDGYDFSLMDTSLILSEYILFKYVYANAPDVILNGIQIPLVEDLHRLEFKSTSFVFDFEEDIIVDWRKWQFSTVDLKIVNLLGEVVKERTTINSEYWKETNPNLEVGDYTIYLTGGKDTEYEIIISCPLTIGTNPCQEEKAKLEEEIIILKETIKDKEFIIVRQDTIIDSLHKEIIELYVTIREKEAEYTELDSIFTEYKKQFPIELVVNDGDTVVTVDYTFDRVEQIRITDDKITNMLFDQGSYWIYDISGGLITQGQFVSEINNLPAASGTYFLYIRSIYDKKEYKLYKFIK